MKATDEIVIKRLQNFLSERISSEDVAALLYEDARGTMLGYQARVAELEVEQQNADATRKALLAEWRAARASSLPERATKEISDELATASFSVTRLEDEIENLATKVSTLHADLSVRSDEIEEFTIIIMNQLDFFDGYTPEVLIDIRAMLDEVVDELFVNSEGIVIINFTQNRGALLRVVRRLKNERMMLQRLNRSASTNTRL